MTMFAAFYLVIICAKSSVSIPMQNVDMCKRVKLAEEVWCRSYCIETGFEPDKELK